MIVVDTSVLVSILEKETDGVQLLQALLENHPRAVSTASLLEAAIVLVRRRGPGAMQDLQDLIAALGIEPVPFTVKQLTYAVEGFCTYGKGMNPVTKLNFGDCFVYGLARSTQAPLLFKGQDFRETDLSFA
jgi:ribonuclease VapC